MRAVLTTVLSVLRSRWITPIVRRLPLWVTPTTLTVLRLFCIPLIMLALWYEWWRTALALYIFAVLTDAFDGEVARLRHQASAVGARLDPAVDKILHVSLGLFFLSEAPVLLSALITLDIVLFVVGAITSMQVHTRFRPVRANVYGKWKFLTQSIAFFLLVLSRFSPNVRLESFLQEVLILSLCFSVASLIGYFTTLRHTSSYHAMAE